MLGIKEIEKLYDNFSQSFINKFSYIDELTRFVCSIFEYENAPETLDSRFLELYLNLHGSVLVGYLENTTNLICVPASLTDNIDAYGLGTNAFGVSPIGEVRGVRGITVAYGRNNKTAIPSFQIYRNADMLTELDKSIMCIINNARMHPIPIAKDKKTKESIEMAQDDIKDGKNSTILSDNVFNSDDMGNSFDVLNLTDVNVSDKIQYLFHSKDDVYRQFYNHYGQSSQGTSKMAQQTISEIENGVSIVDIMDMYNERQILVDDINNIFGTNMTVKFARAWELEIAKYSQTATALDVDERGEDNEEVDTNNEPIE